MTISALEGEVLRLAWKDWQSTGDYANALLWAEYAVISNAAEDGTLRIGHPHTVGSLWGAFAAGYRAALVHAQAHAQERAQAERPEVQR